MKTPYKLPRQRMRPDYWHDLVSEIVEEAATDGVVITVSTRPRLPLAMGNYDLVVEARERRVMSEPIDRPNTPIKTCFQCLRVCPSAQKKNARSAAFCSTSRGQPWHN